MYWLKQKKVIFIVLAALFLVGLFLLKNKSTFTSKVEGGLVYSGNEKIGDLVNRDTDGDGVADWEEGLFGTDPAKKDTNGDGIPDNVEIERRNPSRTTGNIQLGGGETNLEANLNQTDLLSRELFSTVAALNQAGQIDQSTVEALSISLFDQVQNGPARKIFTLSEITLAPNDSAETVRTYNDTLSKIYAKYTVKYTVIDVLQKFIIDENSVDETVLPELDPIVQQTNTLVADMAKTPVPPSLAALHLNLLNALEKISENVSDIRLYDTDIIVAMQGVSQYGINSDALEAAATTLASAVEKRLK